MQPPSTAAYQPLIAYWEPDQTTGEQQIRETLGPDDVLPLANEHQQLVAAAGGELILDHTGPEEGDGDLIELHPNEEDELLASADE